MVIIAHLNVRSLMADGRLSEIASLLSFNNIDILCLSETWLKPHHMNSTLTISGYQPLVRRDRPAGRGGGVAVYLRDGLTYCVLQTAPADIECLIIQVRLPKRKLVTVITCYRPPGGNMENFLDSLDIVMNSAQQRNVIMVGDFNAKNSEWYAPQKTDSEGSALKAFADCHNLVQLVSSPTYNVCSANPVLLDLVFISEQLAGSLMQTVVLPPVADHCAVMTHLSIKKAPTLKPYTKEYWCYADCNTSLLQERLATCDWPDDVSLDLDSAVQQWQHRFLDICASAIPRRKCRVYPSSKPWFSTYLKYLARRRDRLFHRSRKKAPSSRVAMVYRRTRNLFVSELRNAQRRYFATLGTRLSSPTVDPRRWWNLAKKACGWSHPRNLPALLTGSTLVSEPYAKACVLNEHFRLQCSAFASPDLNAVQQPPSAPNPRFEFATISPADIAKKLRGLAGWKSCGPDTVTNICS